MSSDNLVVLTHVNIDVLSVYKNFGGALIKKRIILLSRLHPATLYVTWSWHYGTCTINYGNWLRHELHWLLKYSPADSFQRTSLLHLLLCAVRQVCIRIQARPWPSLVTVSFEVALLSSLHSVQVSAVTIYNQTHKVLFISRVFQKASGPINDMAVREGRQSQ